MNCRNTYLTEYSGNSIAAPFEISQPAVSRHLKVLERAGLIERDIDQQRRPARLKAETMIAAVNWLTEFKIFWGASFDQLDDVRIHMKQAEAKETGRDPGLCGRKQALESAPTPHPNPPPQGGRELKHSVWSG